eukprot:scaffold2115_cov363-Pavlova_lutheri.AAC.4
MTYKSCLWNFEVGNHKGNECNRSVHTSQRPCCLYLSTHSWATWRQGHFQRLVGNRLDESILKSCLFEVSSATLDNS